MAVDVTRLSSGLTIVTDTMPHLESATVGIWAGAGSRDETAGEHGISHLLEHMAFKGTRRRSALAIAQEIEDVGGEINAATSAENTTYYARVLKDDVALAVDLVADILTESVFDPEELEREQHVIVQEIGAAHDTPEDRVFDLLQERAYPDQPIGRPILGTEASVKGFDAAAIRAYLARHYRAPNLVLAAAGAVDHGLLVRLAEDKLGVFAAEAGPAPEPARWVGGEVREARDLMETQLTLGFEGRSYGSGGYHAAQLLASLLGGGMSSRLFQEVREKRGLCYSISAFHWSYTDTGLFGVHAATGEGDMAALVPVVVDEIGRVARDCEASELARAKAQMRAGLLMGLESPSTRAGQIARQILIFGRTYSVAEILERIEAVTVDEVRALAADVFGAARRPSVAAIGPKKALKALDRLRSGREAAA